MKNMTIKFPIAIEDFYKQNVGPLVVGNSISVSLSAVLSEYIKDVELLQSKLVELEVEKSKIRKQRINPQRLVDLDAKIAHILSELSIAKKEKLEIKKEIVDCELKIKKIATERFQIKQGVVKPYDVQKAEIELKTKREKLTVELRRIDFFIESLANSKKIALEEKIGVQEYLVKDKETADKHQVLSDMIEKTRALLNETTKKIVDIQAKQTIQKDKKSLDNFSAFCRKNVHLYIDKYKNVVLSGVRLNQIKKSVLKKLDAFYRGIPINCTSQEEREVFSSTLIATTTKYIREE